jgi:hypothetical protein
MQASLRSPTGGPATVMRQFRLTPTADATQHSMITAHSKGHGPSSRKK